MLGNTENKVKLPFCLFTVTSRSWGPHLWVNIPHFHENIWIACAGISEKSQEVWTTLQAGGKHYSLLATGHSNSCLVFVTDHNPGHCFLVDNWCWSDCYPSNHSRPKVQARQCGSQSSRWLIYFNIWNMFTNTQPEYLDGYLSLQLSSCPFCAQIFSVSIDFWSTCNKPTLWTQCHCKGTVSNIISPSLSLPQHSNTEYGAVMAEFPSVTRPRMHPRPVQHNVTRHI